MRVALQFSTAQMHHPHNCSDMLGATLIINALALAICEMNGCYLVLNMMASAKYLCLRAVCRPLIRTITMGSQCSRFLLSFSLTQML